MKTTKVSTIVALCLVVLSANSTTAMPLGSGFIYQGNANSLMDGLYDFEFALYDDPDLNIGIQVGSSIFLDDIDVVEGHFTVQLDFGSDVFNGEARWLELSVRPGESDNPDDFMILGLRQELSPTPYAIYAMTSRQDNDWMIQGNDMYSMVSGNVGIGTTAPLWKLDVNGEIRASDKLLASNNDGAISLTPFLTYSAISAQRNSPGVQPADIALAPYSGKVGIGTTRPQKLLHIANSNGGYNGLGISLDPGLIGGTSWDIDNDAGVFKIVEKATCPTGFASPTRLAIVGRCIGSTYGGNVGIATESPLWTLDVHGEIRARDQLLASNNDGAISLTPHLTYSAIDAQRNSPGVQPANIAIATIGGNVGIGTTSPLWKLDVEGEIRARDQLLASNYDGAISLRPSLTYSTINAQRNSPGVQPATLALATAGGNVGIGTTNPGSYKLAVNGSAAKLGGGSWSYFSDARLKEIDGDYDRGLAEITALNPVRYRYARDNDLELQTNREFVGVTSQNVQKVIPEAVEEDNQGYLMVNNDPIIWTMVNAMKQLAAENQELKRKIEALERAIQQQ